MDERLRPRAASGHTLAWGRSVHQRCWQRSAAVPALRAHRIVASARGKSTRSRARLLFRWPPPFRAPTPNRYQAPNRVQRPVDHSAGRSAIPIRPPAPPGVPRWLRCGFLTIQVLIDADDSHHCDSAADLALLHSIGMLRSVNVLMIHRSALFIPPGRVGCKVSRPPKWRFGLSRLALDLVAKL